MGFQLLKLCNLTLQLHRYKQYLGITVSEKQYFPDYVHSSYYLGHVHNSTWSASSFIHMLDQMKTGSSCWIQHCSHHHQDHLITCLFGSEQARTSQEALSSMPSNLTLLYTNQPLKWLQSHQLVQYEGQLVPLNVAFTLLHFLTFIISHVVSLFRSQIHPQFRFFILICKLQQPNSDHDNYLNMQ